MQVICQPNTTFLIPYTSVTNANRSINNETILQELSLSLDPQCLQLQRLVEHGTPSPPQWMER